MLHAQPRAAVAIPLPKRIAKSTRHQLEAAIEQHLTAVEGLLVLLDLFDGDPDLEPALGSNESHAGGTAWCQFSQNDDRELDDERELDEDAEPRCPPV